MPADVQARCGVQVGVDIPLPVVDLDMATRTAKARLHSLRAQPDVKAGKAAIVTRHGSRRAVRWTSHRPAPCLKRRPVSTSHPIDAGVLNAGCARKPICRPRCAPAVSARLRGAEWAQVWDEVKYCSDRCRHSRKPSAEAHGHAWRCASLTPLPPRHPPPPLPPCHDHAETDPGRPAQPLPQLVRRGAPRRGLRADGNPSRDGATSCTTRRKSWPSSLACATSPGSSRPMATGCATSPWTIRRTVSRLTGNLDALSGPLPRLLGRIPGAG